MNHDSKQVGKALKSIEEAEAELAKQKAATKELKDATKAMQANRQKVRRDARIHTHTHTHA